MNCEIELCDKQSDCTLKIETDDDTINLPLCVSHADAFEVRIANQLGLARHHVNLRAGRLPGIIADVQDALDYLDCVAVGEL